MAAKKKTKAKAKKKTAKGVDAYAFIVSKLKQNPKVEFAVVRDAAAKKGLTVYPVSYGRAKAALGLVKVAKYGTGKYAQKKAGVSTAKRGPGRPRKNSLTATGKRGPGRPRKDSIELGSLEQVVSHIRDLQHDRAKLVSVLSKVRDLIDQAI